MALNAIGSFLGVVSEVIGSCIGVTQIYALIKWRQLTPQIKEKTNQISTLQQQRKPLETDLEAAKRALLEKDIQVKTGTHPATVVFARTVKDAVQQDFSQNYSHGYDALVAKEILESQINDLDDEIRAQEEELNEMDYDQNTKGFMAIPLFGPIIAALRSSGATSGFTVASTQTLAISDEILGGPIGRKVQSSILFPGNSSVQSPAYVSQVVERWFEPNGLHASRHFVDVTNPDGTKRKIEALHVIGRDPRTGLELPPNARTVVLYHGNGMNAYEMYDRTSVLMTAGFNVYIPTIGGKQYVQSNAMASHNNTHETNELSMYADVDADMEFLRSLGVKQVAPDGLSIGGTKAFQMAQKYGANYGLLPQKNPPYPKCVAIIPEHTLASGKDVMKNAAHNIAGVGDAGREIGEMALPLGKQDRANGNVTDGLNNLGKARAIKGKVKMLAIRATQDKLMGKGNKDKDGNFESDFAFDFAEAVHGRDKAKANVISVEGGHCTPWTYDYLANRRVIEFLNEAMPRKNDL